MVLDFLAVVCYWVECMMTPYFRAMLSPLPYVAECVAALLLGLYAAACGMHASCFYPDNPLVPWAILTGAVLYICAIGAGSRWGIISPLAVLGGFICVGLANSFSLYDWIRGEAWVVYVSAGLGLSGCFRHRRQAWLLPAAALCTLGALIAQIAYTPWKIWYIFDTMTLLLMLAETTCRSIASLCRGDYFYIVPLLKRRSARKSRVG